jgi:hypothetical protein
MGLWSSVFAFSLLAYPTANAQNTSSKTNRNTTSVVYVSPQGSDTQGNGSKSSPYYSLNKAIAGRLQSGSDTLFIEVASGNYYLKSPLTISGSTRPIVFRAQGKEKPRLMGGIVISGWERSQNGIYRAYVPQVKKSGLRFQQFYVNGKRAVLARTPNKGWYFVESSNETIYSKDSPKEYAVQQFNFNSKDWSSLRRLSSKSLNQMKFRFYHNWDVTCRPAQRIIADSARIYVRAKKMKSWNPIKKGSRYIMYDYKEALDDYGEWFLDTSTGYIYYKPQPNEDMSKAFCVAPVLSQWVVVKGSASRPVNSLRFEGLSFQYSSYLMPQSGEEPVQAAAESPAAMRFDFANHVSLVNCELEHTGSYAVWFARECHYNTISHCYIADLGAGGIKMGENFLRNDGRQVTSHNVIDNNIITSGGHVHPCGVGIALFHTSDNRVSHNEISDLLYSGISVGWTWGYNKTSGKDAKTSPAVRNEIVYNHVHHIGWGELSDMGAVYTLGESPGTKVSNNYIHDVWSYDYGGWGLYTDEGSTDVEMSNNLVLRCKSGSFHQNYGKNNVIENNILAFAHVNQLQLSRSESHLSMHFKHNIIIFNHGETLSGPWLKAKLDMDYNLYWRTDGKPITLAGMNFAEWSRQHERHSINADPMFKDPSNDDFTLTSTKTTRKINFKPFDYTQAGVYGDSSWRQKAQMTKERIAAFKELYKEK